MKKRTVLVLSLVVMAFLCLILPLALWICCLAQVQETVGIIGGADAPTFWFLLGQLGIWPYLLWTCAAVLLVAAIVCRRGKH